MDTIAVIQARTGSARLPGKVMYPLDGRPVLEHVVRRTALAECVETVVVATSTADPDDVIAQNAPTFGSGFIRGSESNVMERFEHAVEQYDPDILIRITGDCPLIDPMTIDKVVTPVHGGDVDYASNISPRTFPRGLDVEAFTAESFERVVSAVSTDAEREHVTLYYRDNSEEFDIINVTSDQVFNEKRYIDRTDLRLTLDEADDYRLLKRIYDEVEYDGILPIRDAIDLVDEKGLTRLNESVRQKDI